MDNFERTGDVAIEGEQPLPTDDAPEEQLEQPASDFVDGEHSHLWHATLSGVSGEIVDSIQSRGLLPRSSSGNTTGGNENTPDVDAVYAAESPKSALAYLKHAINYRYDQGGVPVLVAVDVREKGKDYGYDTDIAAAYEEEDGDDSGDLSENAPGVVLNRKAWLALITSYVTVDDFIDEKIPSATAKDIQKRLATLRGMRTADALEQIEGVLREMKPEFLEGQRAERYRDLVDDKRWDAFLTGLIKLAPAGSTLDNLRRRGGWKQEELRRTYVITPGGDADWRKWAALIPPEFVNRWEEWDVLNDVNGNPIGAKGKLVRVS